MHRRMLVSVERFSRKVFLTQGAGVEFVEHLISGFGGGTKNADILLHLTFHIAAALLYYAGLRLSFIANAAVRSPVSMPHAAH